MDFQQQEDTAKPITMEEVYLNAGTPTIPRRMPSRIVDEVIGDRCVQEFRDAVLCTRSRETEEFCQRDYTAFMKCAISRNTDLKAAATKWENEHFARLDNEAKADYAAEISADAQAFSEVVLPKLRETKPEIVPMAMKILEDLTGREKKIKEALLRTQTESNEGLPK